MASLGAYVWARELFGPDAVPFSYLAVGDAFHFPISTRRPTAKATEVFVKTGTNGWMWRRSDGKRFRTSGGSAVIPVKGGS